MSRFARLKEEWLLRGWTDIPWTLVNWRNGNYYRLEQNDFFVARSCDGATDFSSPVFLPSHIALLDRFIAQGIAEECRAGEKPAPAQEYRKARNSFVKGIQWAVTGRCNLNCRHCYMDAPSGQQGEIVFADIMRLLSQFEQANITEVSLTGGEPFQREDLLDLIQLLTAKKIRVVDIYTNATLISNDILQELNKLGVRPIFRVSFDGCSKHDLMRGTPGVEAVVLDAIHRIRTTGFDVAVTTSLDKTNLDCLLPTYEQMKVFDLYAWGIARPQLVGCGRAMTTGLSLQEMIKPCEQLLYRWLADGRPFMLGLEAFYSGAKAGMSNQTVCMPQSFSAGGYVCSSCRYWPYLAPDGRLMPCISYGDTKWPDVLPSLLATDSDFAGAWHDPTLRSLLDIKRSDVLARNPECSACRLLEQCGTGCRTSALIGNGNLMAKDPIACELWQGGLKQHFADLVAAREQAGGEQPTIRGDKQI